MRTQKSSATTQPGDEPCRGEKGATLCINGLVNSRTRNSQTQKLTSLFRFFRVPKSLVFESCMPVPLLAVAIARHISAI